MRDNANEKELEVKVEREGKFKGALRAMKRYVSIAFFYSCLGDNSDQSENLDGDCGMPVISQNVSQVQLNISYKSEYIKF